MYDFTLLISWLFCIFVFFFFFSSRRRHTRCGRDWSSDVCSSDLVFLSEVPQLTGSGQQAGIARGTEDGVTQVVAGDRQLPALSHQDDGVRRFIALVDECYDRGIPLYLDAAVSLNQLYSQGTLAFPFRRTLSRLQEMQLQRFGQ